MKENSFQGDLTDISAKKEALLGSSNQHSLWTILWSVDSEVDASIVLKSASLKIRQSDNSQSKAIL